MVKTLDQKKTRIVNFKLTEDQYLTLQRVAAADAHSEGNVSSLLRRWILGAQKALDAKERQMIPAERLEA